MVGIVISDTFLLTGEWDSRSDPLALKSASKIDYAEPITQHIFNEARLSSIISSALRKAQETYSLSNQNIVVCIPDHFVEHSVLNVEQDLSQDEHLEYIKWLDIQKGRPAYQSIYTFGQIYYPSQENIHICTVSRSLIRTLKLHSQCDESGGI
jgi:hypothetical protein